MYTFTDRVDERRLICFEALLGYNSSPNMTDFRAVLVSLHSKETQMAALDRLASKQLYHTQREKRDDRIGGQ